MRERERDRGGIEGGRDRERERELHRLGEPNFFYFILGSSISTFSFSSLLCLYIPQGIPNFLGRKLILTPPPSYTSQSRLGHFSAAQK